LAWFFRYGSHRQDGRLNGGTLHASKGEVIQASPFFMLDQILSVLVVLVVVIDPVGLAPIFASLTVGANDQYRLKMARQGVLISAGILIVFTIAGSQLLGWLGIGLDAFRIAGGFLLFMLSIDMVFARQSGLRSTTHTEEVEAHEREDISVFPLAIPLIAGPGSMTTLVLMLRENSRPESYWIILGVLIVVLIMTYYALRFSTAIMKRLGETGANVISRLLGVLLSALAVQYIVDGIKGSLFAASPI